MQDTTLLEQLTDDIGIAGQLLELSDQEFTALSERDLASLENILAKKQPLLALLGQHSTQRSQWLTAQQLSADRTGLEALAARSEKAQQSSNKPSVWKRSWKPAAAQTSATAASSAPTRARWAACWTSSRARTKPQPVRHRGGAAKVAKQRP